MEPQLVVKQASEPWEFEQIHRLNYETFVEEIGQHRPNADGCLVDRFHEENTYFIALRDREVVAMLAVRGRRPFSLDAKLENLDAYLPAARAICEVRLLAVKKGVRHTRVIHRLFETAGRYMLEEGYDTAVISGLVEQQRLYRHLGFVPFGPVVGEGQARYQPMMLTIEGYSRVRRQIVEVEPPRRNGGPVYLMPGPVNVSPGVEQAFTQTTSSHRSGEFLELYRRTCRRLCRLAQARQVALLMGSGTLANDMIAGQLALRGGHGVILVNGEFGRRIGAQAQRFGLDFEVVEMPWGRAFEMDHVRRAVAGPTVRWVWAVHCETSTGMVNDIETIKAVCREHEAALCLDCVSSLGTIPVDLSDVWLASGVSGKGLGSYSGLSMVFYRDPVLEGGADRAVPGGADGPSATAAVDVPAYLDLAAYTQADAVPYTMCSNMVAALDRALEEFEPVRRFGELVEMGAWLRGQLDRIGLEPLVGAEQCNPAVVTLALPETVDSARVGDELAGRGFLLSYRSRYLLDHNWIQICLMGRVTRQSLRAMLQALDQTIRVAAMV